MKPLSVIIITKNEETNIQECLESVSWADEIILVDDDSNDRTVEIASRFKQVRIFHKKMNEGFGPQKQYALKQAHNDWIFSIDADERLSAEGRKEIIDKILSDDCDGYYFRRKNFVFGKLINDFQPKNLRLFKRTKGKFSNARVHESVVLDGKIGTIEKPIIHYSRATRSISDYITTLNLYTSLSAQDLYSRGKRINILTIPIYFLLHPLYLFFRLLLLKGHWKDGSTGVLLSFMRVLDGVINYIKLWEYQIKNNRGGSNSKTN
jgi:glycosyltransferase involved in cell wall biosynthesis